jgi:hypothetical protein
MAGSTHECDRLIIAEWSSGLALGWQEYECLFARCEIQDKAWSDFSIKYASDFVALIIDKEDKASDGRSATT